jgi:hypothetical protein
MYAIDKTSALPRPNLPARKGAVRKYPFNQMDVGDSFSIPVRTEEERAKTAERLYNAVQAYRRYHGGELRFAVRRLKDRVGVWRVA